MNSDDRIDDNTNASSCEESVSERGEKRGHVTQVYLNRTPDDENDLISSISPSTVDCRRCGDDGNYIVGDVDKLVPVGDDNVTWPTSNNNHISIPSGVRRNNCSNGGVVNDCCDASPLKTSDSEVGGIVTFLDMSVEEAESRLIAKRQARTEAREIRMREIERQQREVEENADRVFDMYATTTDINLGSRMPNLRPTLSSPNTNSYPSNRHNSVDSLDESPSNFRDFRMELRELEEKFRKSMVQNAQLDNEKAAAIYTVELYKDKYTHIEEELIHIKRKNRESCRENEKLKRLLATQKSECILLKKELLERDKLIEEKGLVIINTEEEDQINNKIKRSLVSVENAELLQDGEGCLDVRLKKFSEERNNYIDEINCLKLELQEAKRHNNINQCSDSDDVEHAQKETNKLLSSYKFKWQKAEQNISTLQANVARLETQVIRYKTACETCEAVENGLKIEKRKLQRELRESLSKIEELETSNMHLLKRFDKLKNAKSSLLKDL